MTVTEFAAPTRHGDPQTSFEAALTIQGEKMTKAMLHVLCAMMAYCDQALCDEELCVHYNGLGLVRQTDQSIRSRRAQLVRLGYIHQVGHLVNRNGNRCRTWKISHKGIQRVADEADF